MKFRCSLLSFLMLGACSGNTSNHAELETVPKVDLNRYLGEWNEIARIDHWFQEGCNNSKAFYSMREDGDIKVLNSCILPEDGGKQDTAIGRAWVTDPQTNAKLKVQFPLRGIKLSFLAGDYWIIDLDPNYQYAMVGDPTREYLWILARDETLPQDTLSKLLEKAEINGFPTERLIYR